MTDRPIIFSAPMVRALLDGRKTQTRRLLKIKGRKGFFQFGRSDLPDYDWTFRRADHVWEDWKHDHLLRKLPYAPGDRLWVREAHSLHDAFGQDRDDGMRWGPWPGLPSAICPEHRRIAYFREGFDRSGPPRWRPSIYMPRWASRLTLAVTDVRVQQLHDISEDDAVAEGCTEGHTVDDISGVHEGWSARTDFRTLWNSLHGPDAWGENPWVVAITFDVHRCNIDTLSEKADA